MTPTKIKFLTIIALFILCVSPFIADKASANTTNTSIEKKQKASAPNDEQAEEDEDAVTLATVNSGVSAILTLLEEVTTGSRKFYTTDDLKVNFDGMPE